jgi:hypothetical protein
MAKQEVIFEEVVERGCGPDVHKKLLLSSFTNE